MSVNVSIYSNANSSSKSVTVDFVGDVLVASTGDSNAAGVEYYFKMTTGARQDNLAVYPVRVARSLSELVLNGNNQSALNSGSANAYSDIKSMVIDYIYDYINGHAADAYSSGVDGQNPMQF